MLDVLKIRTRARCSKTLWNAISGVGLNNSEHVDDL